MICTPKVRQTFGGAFFMKEIEKKRRKYSPEFKIAVIMDMRHNHLNYRETIRKYWNTSSRSEEDLYKQTVKQWERIYLTEGQKGFMVERRGRKSTGRPRKKPLDKEIKKDLVAENQRLNERISLKLKGMSPVQYRTHSQI